jgi:hypothetical protein
MQQTTDVVTSLINLGLLEATPGAGVGPFNLGALTQQFGNGKANLHLGIRGTALSVSMTSRYEPIQLVVTSHANPSTPGTTMNLIYADLETDAAQANARLKVADWTIGVNHDITDAYVCQMELDNTAGSATGQMCTLSATMQLSGTGTIGECQALYVSVGGPGAITTNELTVAKIGLSAKGKKAKAVIETGAAAFASASACILIDGEGAMDSAIKVDMGSGSGITNLFELVTDATKDCVASGGSSGITSWASCGNWRRIPIKIGSATFYIPAITTLTGS